MKDIAKKMTNTECMDILKRLNKWLTGSDMEMIHPSVITEAINYAVVIIEKYDLLLDLLHGVKPTKNKKEKK